MQIQRILKHLVFADWQLRRAFPPASLNALEAAIREGEQTHAGELRLVVEGTLDGLPLWRGQTARERAIDLFSTLRIWDTEHNCGVLIYLLLADHAVEIIADRGIHASAGEARWQAICSDMESAFAKGQFQAGALAGIAAIAQEIRQHFPPQAKRFNELADSPLVLP